MGVLAWGDVTIRAGHGVRGAGEIAVIDELGQPEISDVRFKLEANEDVVGLDVSVDDGRDAVVV